MSVYGFVKLGVIGKVDQCNSDEFNVLHKSSSL